MSGRADGDRARQRREAGHGRWVPRGPPVRRAGLGQDLAAPRGPDPHPPRPRGRGADLRGPRPSRSASFAAGMSAFGIQPTARRAADRVPPRAVANAVQGQQFVFIVDDVDLLCAEERSVMELSDLFSRVISRSGGRARFLFSCASQRLHVLGGLERRTGSLFPPSTRYELARMPAGEASKLLDQILTYSGVAADPALADAVVQGLGRGGPVLPADLQLAGIAMRDLEDRLARRAQAAGRADRARGGVAPPGVPGDGQRAVRAAALRRAGDGGRGRAAGGSAGAAREPGSEAGAAGVRGPRAARRDPARRRGRRDVDAAPRGAGGAAARHDGAGAGGGPARVRSARQQDGEQVAADDRRAALAAQRGHRAGDPGGAGRGPALEALLP